VVEQQQTRQKYVLQWKTGIDRNSYVIFNKLKDGGLKKVRLCQPFFEFCNNSNNKTLVFLYNLCK
jgi:hypothetical protein